MSKFTLGLCEIKVGEASAAGTMPSGSGLTKIGKTYKDTAKITQANSDVTEHYEEGKAAPEIRKKSKKIPVLEFSIMDADADLLASYVGGTAAVPSGSSGTEKEWSYDGDEVVANKAVKVITEQGYDIDIPNADIEAVIDADLSAKGIFLVNFTVTPCAVTSGKAFRCVLKAQ